MDTFTRISVQKAHEIIGSGDGVTIVDIRDPDSFTQGHIANALNVDDQNIKDFLQVTDKEIPLICYCYHGISSQGAAVILPIRDSNKFIALMGVGKNGRLFMVKHLLIFLFLFFMLSSFSFAKDDDAKLKKEYGQDLTHVPYFLRFSFYEKYHRDWKETYYTERKFFLTNYETNLAADQAKEKAEVKAEADKEKERLHEEERRIAKRKR